MRTNNVLGGFNHPLKSLLVLCLAQTIPVSSQDAFYGSLVVAKNLDTEFNLPRSLCCAFFIHQGGGVESVTMIGSL